MNFLLPHHRCPIEDDAVRALFAENLSAHARAGQAADAARRTSDRSRGHLESLRDDIVRRTAAERRQRSSPPTSEVRALVEDVLSRPRLRGLPTDRDPS